MTPLSAFLPVRSRGRIAPRCFDEQGVLMSSVLRPRFLSRESSGYVFNAMLTRLFEAALTLAANGVASVADIDRSWMGITHMPVGPFGIMDSIGLKTVHQVCAYWAERRNDPQARANAAFVERLVAAGHLGVNNGKGFYSYPDPTFRRPDFLAAAGHPRKGEIP